MLMNLFFTFKKCLTIKLFNSAPSNVCTSCFLVYDIPEAVEFGFEQWEDIWERRQSDFNVLFDTVYLKVDAVVDMPHCYFFDAFLKRWPDAKVHCDTAVIHLTKN